jgi:hypothetical protein
MTPEQRHRAIRIHEAVAAGETVSDEDRRICDATCPYCGEEIDGRGMCGGFTPDCPDPADYEDREVERSPVDWRNPRAVIGAVLDYLERDPSRPFDAERIADELGIPEIVAPPLLEIALDYLKAGNAVELKPRGWFLRAEPRRGAPDQ